MCDKAAKTQNMQDSLELAEKLVDSGAMSNEEYLELAKKYKRELLNASP
jgi:predicted metal-binding transcription factor (methanogenesis marker protein 9)